MKVICNWKPPPQIKAVISNGEKGVQRNNGYLLGAVGTHREGGTLVEHMTDTWT